MSWQYGPTKDSYYSNSDQSKNEWSGIWYWFDAGHNVQLAQTGDWQADVKSIKSDTRVVVAWRSEHISWAVGA